MKTRYPIILIRLHPDDLDRMRVAAREAKVSVAQFGREMWNAYTDIVQHPVLRVYKRGQSSEDGDE